MPSLKLRFLPRSRRAVAAIAAVAAGILVAHSLGFDVPSLAHAQRPLVSVEPGAGAREVWLGTTIALSFDRAVDTASVEAAIAVEPPAPGAFVWQKDRVELRPRQPLTPRTTYKVTLGTGARDAQGRPLLTTPFTWSFTTGEWSGNVTFGYGAPVQLLAPSGKHGIGVYPPYPRMTLDFAAYAVDVPGFATRYAAAIPADGGWGEPKKIDVTGLTRVAGWSATVDNSETMTGVRLPKDVPAGLYVVDVRHPRGGDAQALLVYTDHTMVAKQGRKGLLAWTTGLLDAQPAGGAAVSLVDAAGQPVGEVTADADGVARFGAVGAARFAVARVGGQTTLVGLDSLWRSGGYYWRWWDGGWWGGEAPAYAGHVHTDRPIYRPGHTMHFKASLRRFGDDGLAVIAPSTTVSVTIRDSKGNLIQRSAPTADDFGSVTGDLALGDEVALGDWSVQVQVEGQTFYGYFKVEDYVKPDFEVKLATDRPFYIRDETARVTVRADYYFGQPAAGADATLRVYRGYYYRGSGMQPVATLTGTLGADGAWTTSVAMPGNETYTEQVTLEAEVMDATRRPVVGSAFVPVHPAAFTLDLTSDRYGVEAGRPAVYTVRTTGHDGAPASGRKVGVEVRQWHREGFGTIRTESVTTGPDGSATVSFADLKEGWYSVVGQAVDDAGRRIETSSYAWVYSVAYPWYWWGGLELETDKPSYAPGDTLRLLVKSPVTTTALVTIERDEVHDEVIVPVKGGTTVELPIKPEYAPNVWVKVQLWKPSDNAWDAREGQLLTAERLVPVPASDRRLTVEVVPDAPTAAPGETARLTVRVRDAAGRPVDAQVSLALVDKAVLALTADRSGDIFDAFWGQWQNAVRTYDSMQVGQTYRGREDTAGPPAAEPGPGAGRDPNKRDEDAVPPAPRREFKDTAYWNATLVTGPDGDVEVAVALPDNLTTWKAIARAITRTSEAGQGSGELVVTQPVIAEPALPRFAVQGDQFLLDVLGRNYAGGTLTGECVLETPGLVQLDPGARSLALPFNTTQVARWSVVASQVGVNPILSRLTTAGGQDGIELPFEVQAFTVPERFVRSGATATVADEPIDVPFNAVPDASTLEIRVTPGMAVGVLDGVEELIGYPYGCVEQTMSRVLPNAVVGRLVKATGLEAPEIAARLPEYVELGLQKLYGFQNTDGSWGWWHGDGNVYTTAYVLHGLTLTREAGFDVDKGVLDRGFAWLAQAVAQEKDPRMQAYGVYVAAAAGYGDAEAARRLYGQRADLDAFGLGAAALALHRTGQADLAARALDELVARAKTGPSTAWWPIETRTEWKWDDYHWRSMASTEKSTGMALVALAALRPNDPLAPKAARWLMEHRWGRAWPTTQATAFAVLGLTDYIVASGELSSDYDWAVTLDGVRVAGGSVDRANLLQPIPPVVLTGPALAPGPHVVSFSKQGEGTLFYTVLGQMAAYYPAFEPTQADGLGIDITRAYTPIAGRSDSEGWHVGDVVNVRLTVEVADMLQYVLIEDKLPAGLEGLNESLDTETSRVPGGDPAPGRPGGMPIWRWWGYERKEVRADRVTFFASYLPAGTHVFEYAARAITPGTFAARPAEAYPMYRPDVWGRSASDQIAIDAGRVLARPALAGDFDRDCRLTGFDASLVATDWAAGTGRDLTGNGRVSVADIATAAGRAGKVCGDAVPPLPGAAGDVALALRAPAMVRQGEAFDLEVVVDGGGEIGAYELTLRLPTGAFEVVGATNGDRVPGAVALAPRIDKAAGTVRFGGWAVRGAGGGGSAVLARLRLKPLRAGPAPVDVVASEVVTAAGGAYRVTATGAVIGPEPWEPVARLFLPLAWQSGAPR